MSITLAEWEAEFAKLPRERRDELKRAITTLESEPVFKEQFGWTGIFALKISLDTVNWQEENNAGPFRKEDQEEEGAESSGN